MFGFLSGRGFRLTLKGTFGLPWGFSVGFSLTLRRQPPINHEGKRA